MTPQAALSFVPLNVSVAVPVLTNNTRLVVVLDGVGRIPVRFYAPRRPSRCVLGKKSAAFSWNKVRQTGLVEAVINGHATLGIEA